MGISVQNAQMPQRDIFNISAFSGINKSVTPSQIADNEAADILNFMLDEKLALDKRPGYVKLVDLSNSTGIKGMFNYRKTDGTELIIFSSGGNLYQLNPSNNVYSVINSAQNTQSQTNGTSIQAYLYGSVELGQRLDATFTANMYAINYVEVYVSTRNNSPVKLKATIYDETTSTVLGSKTLLDANITVPAVNRFTFDLPISITPGHIIQIRIGTDNSGTISNSYGVYHHNADVLANSFFIYSTNGWSTKTDYSGYDLRFNLNYSYYISHVADTDILSFKLNDKIYFMDGTNFLSYDGNSLVDVVANAYVPVFTLGRSPTGGGTSNEQWNQIGRGFIDSFSANGSATLYTLSFNNLDADAVVVTYNGVTKTEGTHFTVDRAGGQVNFSAGTSPMGAPSAGTNNLTIKAYKTLSDYTTRKNKILNCTNAVYFGGSNDTRILLSCNPNTKNVIYRSGINATGYADPTYWPENTYNLIGANNETIVGMSKQYDSLIIHKENTTYQMNFSLDSNNLPVYTTKPINDTVGLTAPNSVQIIENNPTFLNKKGVWRLIQSNVRDERNMKQISDNIDADLLNESNIQNAVSIDYNRKYIINLNEKCYVYDYNQESATNLGPWFVWDNINASCFLEYNGYLYFGSKTLGKVFRFNKTSDSNVYYDDGQPITCRWRSKLLSMSAENFYKLIDKVYITLKPGSHTSAKIYYSTDTKDDVYKNEIELVSFDFSNLDFSNFTFENTTLPKTFRLDIKEKKIVYFQILIENSNVGESLGILNVGIQHAIQKQI